MEFRVLGPLEVRRDGGSIELRGSKRRAVLALLVLHANEVIRTDRLIEEVWGEDLPANASAALQNHVSRLRKDLGADVLVTKPWGYVLRTDPETIDLTRFERLVAEAKPLAAHERTALLAEALALWRGPALADLAHEPALPVEIARLDELRLAALEQRIDADLELGRHAELVLELEALVAEQPLRERFRGQLILALYRSGRQAEALETYRETRRVLVEELGIEPSSELRELERAILRQDPSLASAPPRTAVEAESGRSRWRWPRSPLLVAAVVLLLAGGAAAAIVATRGKAAHHGKAAAVARGVQESAPKTSSSRSTTEPAAATANKINKHASRVRSRTIRPASTVRTNGSRQHAARRHRVKSQATSRPKHASTPTSKPSKPHWLTVSDDFSDPSIDRTIWHVIDTGTQVEVGQTGSRLEISIGPGAVAGGAYNVIDGHYGTQCRFPSDFDAQVDFTLLGWPEANGVFAGLNAFFADTAVGRQSSIKWGENYAAWVIPNNGGIPGATDTSGSLRIARTDGTLSAYVLHKGSWLRVASGRNTSTAVIGLQAMSNDEDFGHKPVRVAFDNFVVKAKAPACPYS